MSPEQIAAVRRTWSAALRSTDALGAVVLDSLAGGEATAGRARWAVDSVTRLLLVLDRPTAFTAVAEAEIARLPSITLEEIDHVRDAIVAAVESLADGLSTAEVHAWSLAFALFRELVAAQHLDPFRTS